MSKIFGKLSPEAMQIWHEKNEELRVMREGLKTKGKHKNFRQEHIDRLLGDHLKSK